MENQKPKCSVKGSLREGRAVCGYITVGSTTCALDLGMCRLQEGAELESASTDNELDDDHPLWLVNEQIKGLLEGDGSDEDHDDVISFLRATGLPDSTVMRMHKALVHGDSKVLADD